MARYFVTFFIFGFCGLMTGLLVRSVYFPEESRLAEMPVRAVLEAFAARNEPSDLDLMEDTHFVGTATVTPQSSLDRLNAKLERATVSFAAVVGLDKDARVTKDKLNFHGEVVISAAGEMESGRIKISAKVRGEKYELEVEHSLGDGAPRVSLARNEVRIFSTTGKQDPDVPAQVMLQMLLSSAGLSMDVIDKSKAAAETMKIVARNGRMEAGGEEFDGMLLMVGEGTKAFRIYFDTTGMVRKVTTPVGFFAVARSLRAPGLVVPEHLDLSKGAISL